MKKLVIKGKKGLSVISGVLFSAMILNNLANYVPINHIEANEYSGIGNLSISTSVEIEENVINKSYEINTVPTYVPDAQKVANIRNYLSNRNSPLAQYAEEFVKAADHYEIDYRIVAAISVVESGAGIHNFRPHNAWGWGRMSFENWTEGIWTVSGGISRYYARGMTTPELMAPRYCPPNAEYWARTVRFVMNQIES